RARWLLTFASAVVLCCLSLAIDVTTARAKPARPRIYMPVGRVAPARSPQVSSGTAASGLANVVYHGGAVISNVKVVQVIWGPGTYLPETTSTTSPSVASFLTAITNSPYLDWLSEYDTPNQTIGRGSFAGRYTISPALNGS